MSSSKPVALILGATGRTGSHLVSLLEQDRGPDDLELCVAVGQTMEPAYFECIVRQMELLQSGKLPDFADVYDNVPQIIGQQPITLREFVRNNRAAFEVV